MVNIKVLESIGPSVDSQQAESLSYDKLYDGAMANMTAISEMSLNVWNAEAGSVEEEKAARLLAMQYLLMTAVRLNGAYAIYADTDPLEVQERQQSVEVWSDRYTTSASELYGVPDKEHASALLSSQLNELLELSQGDEEQTACIQSVAEALAVDIYAVEKEEAPESPVIEQLREYMGDRYYSVLEPILTDAEIYHPVDIVASFRVGIDKLAEEHDSDWKDWTVVLDPERDRISVISSKKQIIVGERRPPATKTEMVGLFGHEVLTHAHRSINGNKGDSLLGKGLAGYLDAEEGVATLIEQCLSGNYPQKNIDRYVDISLALGLIDDQPKTRQWLVEFAKIRAIIRNQQLPENKRKTDEEIKETVYTHVNRIYRGGPGNEFVSVFPKDIAYHNGYRQMLQYIGEQLKTKNMNEVMGYIMLGKFDPSNPTHQAYVERLQDISTQTTETN